MKALEPDTQEMVAQDKSVADSACARKAVVSSTIRKGQARVENEVRVTAVSDLENVLSEIRLNHFHRIDLSLFFKEDYDKVTTAQVSLDVAENSMAAISCFFSRGIGNDVDEKYLRLYGVLQAVFLQQDVAAMLCRLFLGSWIEPELPSAWKTIRDLSNLTIGHPIERGKGHIRRSFLTQISLQDDGFDYQVWHTDSLTFSFERAELGHFCRGTLTRLQQNYVCSCQHSVPQLTTNL